ncbi:hypothetical protein B0H13DRAFT_2124494 [Mycena leptocephala]|nr:hypothetical protein B0H13DRAFT_2124494 [Mycena leptocephala]
MGWRLAVDGQELLSTACVAPSSSLTIVLTSLQMRRLAHYCFNIIQSMDLLVFITFMQFLPDLPLDLDLIDLDKKIFVYVATRDLARRIHTKTGVAWWRIVVDGAKQISVLGRMAVAGEADEFSTKVFRLGLVAVRRRARKFASTIRRIAGYGLNGIRSMDILFVITFVGLPFDVPFGHLIYALDLDETTVSFLAAQVPLPPPTPFIRRATNRYKRGRKAKLR